MKKTILILLFVSLFSCKNENKNEETSVAVEKEAIDKTLMRITFKVIAEKDDKASLFYTEDGTINFDDKKTVWADVKGSPNPQELVFILPKDVLPTHLRLDLGRGVNPEQTYYDIKGFKVEYLDKKFEADNINVFNYFYANKDVNIITANSTVLKKMKPEQETAVILYPHKPLSDELSKIIQ
ncbi:hypothetical protein [Flavobacterium solisilvae]|uniref:Lipoprotein n=1 Tax=Flavobacterium solisilvae TaxID=1852019 RepID=A0ABX1QVE7_9FLAO|nr:hypothetical protein [Flavobacterium solisilvae]NMH25796.1 hypothetical protein [Flavobacterium solisilvae]